MARQKRTFAQPELTALIQFGDIGGLEQRLIDGLDPDTDIELGDRQHSSLLHFAIHRKAYDIIELLLQYGADPNKHIISDEHFTSAVHTAVHQNDAIAVKLLLEAGGSCGPMPGGEGVIVYAGFSGKTEALNTILEFNDPTSKRDKDGYLEDSDRVQEYAKAMVFTIMQGHHEAVEAFLKYGTPVNISLIDGNNALIAAVVHGHYKVARVLIKHGVKVNFRNADGLSALDIAKQKKLQPLMKLLEKAVSESSASQTPNPSELGKSETTLDRLLEELDALTGLDRVKDDVRRHIQFLRVQQMRREKGFVVPEQSLHMVFFGKPGTGKTTVARLLGQIYRELHILSIGHFTETDRSGLIAEYLGQTAIKVASVVEKARGGVLFIDEAYSLTPETTYGDSYGQEAIGTLVKLMEDYRNDLIVVVAGYPERMEQFLQSNPGLGSRFSKRMFFDDYSPNELREIFSSLASRHDYRLTSVAEATIAQNFESAWNDRDEHFGNARLARNWFEEAVRRHSERVSEISSPTDEDLCVLTETDISRGIMSENNAVVL